MSTESLVDIPLNLFNKWNTECENLTNRQDTIVFFYTLFAAMMFLCWEHLPRGDYFIEACFDWIFTQILYPMTRLAYCNSASLNESDCKRLIKSIASCYSPKKIPFPYFRKPNTWKKERKKNRNNLTFFIEYQYIIRCNTHWWDSCYLAIANLSLDGIYSPLCLWIEEYESSSFLLYVHIFCLWCGCEYDCMRLCVFVCVFQFSNSIGL